MYNRFKPDVLGNVTFSSPNESYLFKLLEKEPWKTFELRVDSSTFLLIHTGHPRINDDGALHALRFINDTFFFWESLICIPVKFWKRLLCKWGCIGSWRPWYLERLLKVLVHTFHNYVASTPRTLFSEEEKRKFFHQHLLFDCAWPCLRGYVQTRQLKLFSLSERDVEPY